jgi:glycosyltransferase involved in cell wall biosynthesis
MRVLRIAHSGVLSAWRQRDRELQALGVDVSLISARMWNEGGRDVRLDSTGDEFVRGTWTIGRHPSVFLYNPVAIWRALGTHPDLIDLHEEPNALATAEVLLLRRLRGVTAPYVLYSAQNVPKRYPIPFRWFERAALAPAAAAYVCNSEAGRILRRKGLKAPAVDIPLGVDLRMFEPASRSAPIDTGGRRVIGYIGRLESHKGVEVLLRAAAAEPGWELRLTGDGPQRAALESLVAELGMVERVHFLGHAAGHELADRYRELDALAVPSLPTTGWLEQFCRVAVEAMAAGVPVVASRSGAIPDVVGDAGILVTPGDSAALALALNAALEPETWTRLRRDGLERATSFTWENVARLQKIMYDNVLESDAVAASRDPQVLVIAYGPPDDLDACLADLGDELPVTVVDNSSSLRTREVALRHGARYVDAGRNRGFAGGVNLGLRTLADAGLADRDVLLLNPDARLAARGVRQMQETLHSTPRIAAVGATQTNPENGEEVQVWWPFPTPSSAWFEAVGLGKLRCRHDFAIGSALLLNAQALTELGPLDERFFLYAEETDWQRRARSAGWGIRVAPVGATHVGAGAGGDPRVREGHFYASAERYIRKHFGPGGWQVYRAANILNAMIRGLLLNGERRTEPMRRLRLFLRGPVASLKEPQRTRLRRFERDGARSADLHVVHVVCSEAFAGVERYVQETAIAMAQAGASVTVVGGGDQTMRPRLEENGVRWLPGGRPVEALRSLRALHRVDVIDTHMTQADLVGVVFAAVRRIPVVSTRHFAAHRGSSFPARAALRVLPGRITDQIAISRFVADAIEGRSEVVRSGVRAVPNVDEAVREPLVLVLQRLEPEKHTDVALRAWAATEHPRGWKLVIAGEGSQDSALRRLADELRIADSVEFVGFQSDVSSWLARASIVFASAPLEPFGLSVLEAMAHGLPVVAAAGGGHLETVGGVQDPALFPPGDIEAAAAQLSRLIDDAALRTQYGRALRERQRIQFSIGGQVTHTLDVLGRVVARKLGR